MDCIAHGDVKSRTRLSDFHFTVEYKNYKMSNCNAEIYSNNNRQNKWMVMEILPMCGAVGTDWEGRSEFWAVLEMFCVLIWVPKLQVSKTLHLSSAHFLPCVCMLYLKRFRPPPSPPLPWALRLHPRKQGIRSDSMEIRFTLFVISLLSNTV